jgi:hypothetical protein
MVELDTANGCGFSGSSEKFLDVEIVARDSHSRG